LNLLFIVLNFIIKFRFIVFLLTIVYLTFGYLFFIPFSYLNDGRFFSLLSLITPLLDSIPPFSFLPPFIPMIIIIHHKAILADISHGTHHISEGIPSYFKD